MRLMLLGLALGEGIGENCPGRGITRFGFGRLPPYESKTATTRHTGRRKTTKSLKRGEAFNASVCWLLIVNKLVLHVLLALPPAGLPLLHPCFL